MAASETVRAIGPAVSWLWAMGTMPLRDTRPSVGLIRTSAPAAEGCRRGVGAEQHERAGESGQPVRGSHVVFHEHRDAVQWSARALRLPLGAELLRDARRVRIHPDDRVQCGPAPVEVLDAPE